MLFVALASQSSYIDPSPLKQPETMPSMVSSERDYDWAKELNSFEETKAGVKGLIDAGVNKLPRLFVHPPEVFQTPVIGGNNHATLQLPTIDFQGLDQDDGARRKEIVAEISNACETWGFFRIVNHGIPIGVMDAMTEAVRRFHELPTQHKSPLYTQDSSQKVRFHSNGNLRQYEAACWRDMLICVLQDDTLDPEAIPSVCRKEVQEYAKYMIKLRETMAELLSEALGLSSDYLSKMEWLKSESLACLCYPVCPEPELTLGTDRHSDTTFLTLLMQDDIGGLQILHQDQWLNIPPVHGALIANVGDLTQVISNDRFKSVEHRVVAQPVGPRISVACFFMPSSDAVQKPFAPIKDLLSDENPPVYREVLFLDYIKHYKTKGKHVNSALPHFRINPSS